MTGDAQEFAADLRELADWYEAHPDYPVPNDPSLTVFVDGAEDLRRAARAGGQAVKVPQGSYFTLRRVFGSLELDVFTLREKVCRAIVTGTEKVPGTKAYTQNVVEWVCEDPLLAPEVAS